MISLIVPMRFGQDWIYDVIVSFVESVTELQNCFNHAKGYDTDTILNRSEFVTYEHSDNT